MQAERGPPLPTELARDFCGPAVDRLGVQLLCRDRRKAGSPQVVANARYDVEVVEACWSTAKGVDE